MALVGSINHRGTFDLAFENKTPDVKSFLEQSHSKFPLHHIIPRNNLDQIKHLQPTSFKFLDETFLANKLKSWGKLSYKLGTVKI